MGFKVAGQSGKKAIKVIKKNRLVFHSDRNVQPKELDIVKPLKERIEENTKK